ncbi:MAG TPA: glycerol-3-phosphate dehydrogenase/oxidase, partial [Thermoplasmata archaeon]|nr:glycerol-3-phosphate dehydrogenase/oxidase [Thermoplasmata archaeon]
MEARTTEFSSRTRAANLERMAQESFDVLVIGGGIVGAGIARESAVAGLRTALVERGDFAGGTSGKTSRLVHGGLRYLRDYRVRLVRQAVQERDLLLKNAPSLVHPLPFLIAAYKDRPPRPLVLRFGLFLYDILSRKKAVPRRVWLHPDESREREPQLATNRLSGAGVYFDAWTNDARLVLAIVQDAAFAGAVVANYVEVVELLREGARVRGARVRDVVTGHIVQVRARIVVNATGVWLDRLRPPRPNPTIRPTKGSHIFLPRSKVGNRHALALSTRRDGRMVFVIPWGDLTLVGTTDTDFSGDPQHVLPSIDDVRYLLDVVNDAFPEAKVRPDDIVSAYAGLRPLVRARASPSSESDVSREHAIFEDADGLISVAGGKLTTHRAMAEDVIDRIGARLGKRLRSQTSNRQLGPAERPLDDFTALGLDEPTALHLQGRVAPDRLRQYLDAPRGRDRIVEGAPHIWAEIDLALQEEMAVSLSDVLVRRLGLFYEAPDQ